MLRTFAAAALALGAAGVTAFPASAESESFTTRIEPRAFYGATVTIEEGVRVFRPLPSQRQVIINPGGVTPLSLGYSENRVYEESHNYNYGEGSVAVPDRSYGLPLFFNNGFKGHGPKPGHSGKSGAIGVK